VPCLLAGPSWCMSVPGMALGVLVEMILAKPRVASYGASAGLLLGAGLDIFGIVYHLATAGELPADYWVVLIVLGCWDVLLQRGFGRPC